MKYFLSLRFLLLLVCNNIRFVLLVCILSNHFVVATAAAAAAATTTTTTATAIAFSIPIKTATRTTKKATTTTTTLSSKLEPLFPNHRHHQHHHRHHHHHQQQQQHHFSKSTRTAIQMSSFSTENVADDSTNTNNDNESLSFRKQWIVSSLPPTFTTTAKMEQKQDENSKDEATAATATTTTTNVTRKKPFRVFSRLILHLDINETILLGDPAGGDSREDSIQKMLTKSAFCQVPKDYFDNNNNNKSNNNNDDDNMDWKNIENTEQMEPTHWWDGQPILVQQQQENESSTVDSSFNPPPLYTGWEWPNHCIPYYRTKFKKKSKTFCDHDGQIYQPLLHVCENALQKSHILPAFYKTLEYLITQAQQQQQQQQSQLQRYEDNQPPFFTLVFRTFGSDIDEIAQLVTDFAKGKHPDYPHIQYPDLELPLTRLYQGRWKQQQQQQQQQTKKNDNDNNNTNNDDDMENNLKENYVYQLWNKDETELIASGDDEILQLLQSCTICGIRDDYDFWNANGWNPMAGKPVWIPKPIPMNVSNNDNNKKNDDEDGDDDDNDNNVTILRHDHHLLFDDNIHNLPNDGIASVRREVEKIMTADTNNNDNDTDNGDDNNQNSKDSATTTTTTTTKTTKFVTLDGKTMHQETHGIHLIRVPTIEPVLNPNWYIEQIQKAQEQFMETYHSSNGTVTVHEKCT